MRLGNFSIASTPSLSIVQGPHPVRNLQALHQTRLENRVGAVSGYNLLDNDLWRGRRGSVLHGRGRRKMAVEVRREHTAVGRWRHCTHTFLLVPCISPLVVHFLLVPCISPLVVRFLLVPCISPLVVRVLVLHRSVALHWPVGLRLLLPVRILVDGASVDHRHPAHNRQQNCTHLGNLDMTV